MVSKDILTPLLYILLGAGLPMLKEVTGVVLVGIAFLGLWWVHLPAVAHERGFDRSRPQSWLWSGWVAIIAVCLFWGWVVSPENYIRPYTISEEDEMEFVQAWRTIERISDVEIAHADGDVRATALAERISELVGSCSWSVKEWNGDAARALVSNPPPGVTIWAMKSSTFPRSAGLLKALLTESKIEARLRETPPGVKLGDPWGSLRIFVGPDPQSIRK